MKFALLFTSLLLTNALLRQDYNESRIKQGKTPVGFRLTGVEKVVNPVLEHRFALRQQAMKARSENKCSAEELRERFAFHGPSVPVFWWSLICLQARIR